MNTSDHKLHIVLGSLIREIRKQRGLSAPELAKRMGQKNASHLLRIERGEVNPKLVTIHRIATVFDMDAHKLIQQAQASMDEEW
jgi:transcriptional regulator with XRE-family HTH domain